MFDKGEKEKRLVFPADADGDALRRLLAHNTDFSIPHTVDFTIAIPDENNGEKVLFEAIKHSLECKLLKDSNGPNWTCYCSKKMLLIYDDLIQVQELLNNLSEPFGGHCDGWGTFGDGR